jgi:hypothetical protein
MKMTATNRPTNHGRQGSTGGNSVLPQLAVTCKIEAECYYQTFVQVDSVVLRNRQLRQHAKRCGAIRRHIGSPDCMRRCGLERLTSAHLRDFSADRSFATPAPKPRKSGDPLPAIIKRPKYIKLTD